MSVFLEVQKLLYNDDMTVNADERDILDSLANERKEAINALENNITEIENIEKTLLELDSKPSLNEKESIKKRKNIEQLIRYNIKAIENKEKQSLELTNDENEFNQLYKKLNRTPTEIVSLTTITRTLAQTYLAQDKAALELKKYLAPKETLAPEKELDRLEKFAKYHEYPWFNYLRIYVIRQMINHHIAGSGNHPLLVLSSINERYIQGEKLLAVYDYQIQFRDQFFEKLSVAIDAYLKEELDFINSCKNESIAEIKTTVSNLIDNKAVPTAPLLNVINQKLASIYNATKLANHFANIILFGEKNEKLEEQAKKNARITLENAYVDLAEVQDYDRHAADKTTQELKRYPKIQQPHKQLFDRLYKIELIKLNQQVYPNNKQAIDDFLNKKNVAKLIVHADIDTLTCLSQAKKSIFPFIEQLKNSGHLHDLRFRLKGMRASTGAYLNNLYYKIFKLTTTNYKFYKLVNEKAENVRQDSTAIVPKYADRKKANLAKLSKKTILDDATLYVISSLAYLDVVGKEMPEQKTKDFYEHIRYLSKENLEKWQNTFDKYVKDYRNGHEISLNLDAKKPADEKINKTTEGKEAVYKRASLIIANAYLKLAEQGYDRNEAFEIEQSLNETVRLSFSTNPIQIGLNKKERIEREFRNARHSLRLYGAVQFLIDVEKITIRFNTDAQHLTLHFSELTPEERKILHVSDSNQYLIKLKYAQKITEHYDRYLLREHNANIKHLNNIKKNRENTLTNVGQNAGYSAGIGTALNTLAIVTGGLLGMSTLGWPFVATMLAYAGVWMITNPIIDYIWPSIEKTKYLKNPITGDLDLVASDKWKKSAKTILMLLFTMLITTAAITVLAITGVAAWWIPFIAFAGLVIYASSKFMNINFFKKMTHALILKLATMDKFYRFKLYLGFIKEFKLTKTQQYILMTSIVGNILMGVLYASLTYLRLTTFISDNIKEFVKNHILGPDLYNTIANLKFESDKYPILADIGNFFLNNTLGMLLLIPQLIIAGFAVCIFIGYAILTTRPVAELVVFLKNVWEKPNEYFTWIKLQRTITTFFQGIGNIWDNATQYEAYHTADKRNGWTMLGAIMTLTVVPVLAASIYYAFVYLYRYPNTSKVDKYNLLTFTGLFNFVADYAIKKPIIHPLKAMLNFLGGIFLGCLPFVSAAGAIALLSVSSESFAGILEEDINLSEKDAQTTSKVFLLFSIAVKTPLVVYSAFDAASGLSSDKKANPHAETMKKKIDELEKAFKDNTNPNAYKMKLKDFMKKYEELSTRAAYAAQFNAIESIFKIFVNAALQSELAIYDKDDPSAYLNYQTFRDYLFGGGAFAQSLSLGMMSRLGYQGAEAAELVKTIMRAFRRTHIRLINDYCENNPTEAINQQRRKEIAKYFLNIDENGDANFKDIPDDIMKIIVRERDEKIHRKKVRDELEVYVSSKETSYLPPVKANGYALRTQLCGLLNDSNYNVITDDDHFSALAEQYQKVAEAQKQAFLNEYKSNNLTSDASRQTTNVSAMDNDKVLTVINERRVKKARQELHNHMVEKSKSLLPTAKEKGTLLLNDNSEPNQTPSDDNLIDKDVGFWSLANLWNQFCEVDDQKISKPDTTTRVLLNQYKYVENEYNNNSENYAIRHELR